MLISECLHRVDKTAAPPTWRTHCDSSRFQVRAGGFATDSGRLLDAPQRPTQPSQSQDLLFLLFVQDIAHAHGGYKSPRVSMSQTSLSLAGFQVILIGRFWVIAEAYGWLSSEQPSLPSETLAKNAPHSVSVISLITMVAPHYYIEHTFGMLLGRDRARNQGGSFATTSLVWNGRRY